MSRLCWPFFTLVVEVACTIAAAASETPFTAFWTRAERGLGGSVVTEDRVELTPPPPPLPPLALRLAGVEVVDGGRERFDGEGDAEPAAANAAAERVTSLALPGETAVAGTPADADADGGVWAEAC